MIQLFGTYIKTIAAFLIFSAFAEIIMPNNKYKKYINIVLGFLMIATILRPLGDILGSENIDFINSAGAVSEFEIISNTDKSSIINDGEYYSQKQNEFVTEIYKNNINEDIQKRLLNENINVTNVATVINENYEDEGYGQIISINITAEEGAHNDLGIVEPVEVKLFGEDIDENSKDNDELKGNIIQYINGYYGVSFENINVNIN